MSAIGERVVQSNGTTRAAGVTRRQRIRLDRQQRILDKFAEWSSTRARESVCAQTEDRRTCDRRQELATPERPGGCGFDSHLRSIISKSVANAIEIKRSRVGALLSAVRTRTELRDVECVERWAGKGTIEVVRTDTGEVVRARAATTEEQQGRLFEAGVEERNVDA